MILGPFSLQETNQREASSEHHRLKRAGIFGAPQLWKVETGLPLQQPCLRFAQLWEFFLWTKIVNITKQLFLHEHGGLKADFTLEATRNNTKDSANPSGGFYGKEQMDDVFLRFS